MKISSKLATPRHLKLYASISTKLREAVEGFDDIDALTQLGVICNVVGKLVALQDGTKYSPQTVMDIVARNLEQGNVEAAASLFAYEGRA